MYTINYIMPKMFKNNRYELRSKKYNSLQQFQKNNSSDDDDELSSGSEEFDLYEYRKLLSDMFPSKFMTQRVEDTRKSVRRKHTDSPPNEPRKRARNKTIFDTNICSQNEIIDFQTENEDYCESDEDY